MSKSDKTDHWRALASEIGAEINEEEPDEPVADSVPEAEAQNSTESLESDPESLESDPGHLGSESDMTLTRPDSESEADETSAPTTPSSPSPPPAPPRTSSWADLASKLGIKVPDPPVPPAVEEDSLGSQQDEPSETRDTGLAADASREQSEQSKKDGVSFFEPDSVQETDTADIDISDDLDNEADEQPDQEFEPSETDEESRDGETGIASRGRRRRPRGGRRRRPSSRSDTETEEQTDTDERAQGDQDSDGDAGEDEASTAGEQDQPSEGRSRRRRRRRRPSRRDETEAGDQETSEGGETTDDDNADIGSDSDEGSDEKSETKKHRKIPTWDEAVSVIVTTNLESRSKSGGDSKNSPRGSRRRGRGPNKRS